MNFKEIKNRLDYCFYNYINSPFSYNIIKGLNWKKKVTDTDFNTVIIDMEVCQYIIQIRSGRIDISRVDAYNNSCTGFVKQFDTSSMNSLIKNIYDIISEYDLEDSETDYEEDEEMTVGRHEQALNDYNDGHMGSAQ